MLSRVAIGVVSGYTLPSDLMQMVPLAFTMLISGRKTMIEQRTNNRINPNANFFTLNTNNIFFNPKFIVIFKQDFR